MVSGAAAGTGAAAATPADLRARVVGRYQGRSRYTQGYVAWKLRLDPVHRAVLDLAAAEPLGRVVDLGCGRAQLGVALLEAGLATGLTGLDWDAGELADARHAAAGLDAAFVQADLRAAAIPAADTVLIIDVLYQMPAEAQLDLLARAAASARSRLVARVFDPDRGWRSRVGWLSEAGIWAAGLYRRASIRPTPIATLEAALDRAGFACETRPCWG
jgi:SAM-dependent methyltransferase